jgi:hypothetical protein
VAAGAAALQHQLRAGCIVQGTDRVLQNITNTLITNTVVGDNVTVKRGVQGWTSVKAVQLTQL